MPKVSADRLKTLAKEFENDGIVSDGSIIKCSFCDLSIKMDINHQKQQISQHISTIRHRENKARESKASSSRQTFIGAAFEAGETETKANKQFALDLTSAFLQSGIPLNKVNSLPIKSFLEKYTHRHVPDESTLRKNYTQPIYDSTIQKIRSEIGDSDVALILDESTDQLQRFVLNILIMPLNGKAVKPMLIKVSLQVFRFRILHSIFIRKNVKKF